MKIKVWVSVLVFALLVCSGNLVAKERRGAELVVHKLDRQRIEGELIAVRQNSLVLLTSEGADVSVDIMDISAIRITKKSKTLLGAGIGFIAGVGFGALCGFIGWEIFNWAPHDTKTKYRVVAAGGCIGGLAGGLFGGRIGANANRFEIIQIEGKSDIEIKEILEKLREQARVNNAQ